MEVFEGVLLAEGICANETEANVGNRNAKQATQRTRPGKLLCWIGKHLTLQLRFKGFCSCVRSFTFGQIVSICFQKATHLQSPHVQSPHDSQKIYSFVRATACAMAGLLLRRADVDTV
jgi:hypothetical protein